MKTLRTTTLIILCSALLTPTLSAQNKSQLPDKVLSAGTPLSEQIHISQFLEFNNVKARFYSGGSDFWDHALGSPSYEVPKGSGKHTIFTADLWIGGVDSNGQLRIAAQRYVANGHDFYPGPIMDSSNYSLAEDSIWDRLWKISKAEIDDHIANWDQPGYTAPGDILNWPGNGDTAKGQAVRLAPYYDENNDQYYDPYDGDYPLIKGDQTMYFMRNDDRDVHNETGGNKMQIEIHGMAYAFDCSSDAALFTTVFVNYKIINRSDNTYSSAYVGINADMDIGIPTDDFIGCDVERGSFFTYNGSTVDGPAQSVTFLGGPIMDADAIDNPNGGCDESINGLGFGDGVIDNERLGMTSFAYYCNPSVGCNGAIQGDPSTAADFYSYLKGFWKDGTQMKYGGNGHANNCTSCEDTRFMFPDGSDQCNWGTGGVVPGDTNPWSEQTAGNTTNDRRGLGSMGPFTFEAGDTIELDIAYVYGNDLISIDPAASILVIGPTLRIILLLVEVYSLVLSRQAHLIIN